MVRRMIAIAALLVIAVPTAAQAQYTPSPLLSISLSSTVAGPGDTITVETSGWEPGSEVQITLEPGGRVLATVIADDTGTAVAEVTIPTDLAPGEYTITASGIDAEGNPGSVSAGVVIVDDDAVIVPPGVPRATPPTATTGILPLTGSSTSQLVLAGMALLVAGLGAAFVAHRRLNPAA